MLSALCLIILQFLNYALLAEIVFDIHLDTPDLSLDCKYNLTKGEKLNHLSIKKDGQIFFRFDGKGKNILNTVRT